MIIRTLLFISAHQFVLMACFVVAAGLYFFLRGFQLFVGRRSLEYHLAPDIRSATLGRTAIYGEASGPFTLAAPISGLPCYLYRTTVWQQESSNQEEWNQEEWKKIAEETLHLPFFVEDSTGQLLVEPLGADLDLQQDLQNEYGLPSTSLHEEKVPPRVSAFLSRHGIALTCPTRIEESSIQPETPIFITGTLAENPGIQARPYSPDVANRKPDSLYRGTAENYVESDSHSASRSAIEPKVIRLASGPAPTSTVHMTQQGKIAAALNRAGITKPEAWVAAGVPFQSEQSHDVAVADQARSAANSASGDPNAPTKHGSNPDSGSLPPFVLMKGSSDATFTISRNRQPEPAGSRVWQSVAMVVFGASLTVLGVYALLIERHLR